MECRCLMHVPISSKERVEFHGIDLFALLVGEAIEFPFDILGPRETKNRWSTGSRSGGESTYWMQAMIQTRRRQTNEFLSNMEMILVNRRCLKVSQR